MSRIFDAIAAPTQFELEEKRSRFLTYLYPIEQKSEGNKHLEQLKQQYPDARHYCTAYILGDPEQAQAAGFNDDGEPSGTAGKPMLNVLMQRKVGNVYAVVVRYFGGIKLGAGGLTRAYGAAVSGAVDNALICEVHPVCTFKMTVPFAMEERARNILNKAHITNITCEYNNAVIMTVQCEARLQSTMREKIVNQTAGKVHFDSED